MGKNSARVIEREREREEKREKKERKRGKRKVHLLLQTML